VFNATFSNISAISWRTVLVVEEAGVPEENHRPRASNWYTLSLVRYKEKQIKTKYSIILMPPINLGIVTNSFDIIQ
jgi:hypothetical protein